VTVSKLCDEGRLKEGEHWRRIGGDRSRYLIRRQVIMEMRLQAQREAKLKGYEAPKMKRRAAPAELSTRGTAQNP
jgi:hypothetical protein